MKLPLLLAQFLYKHKKLALPGIGIFTLDPSAEIPDANSKNSHSTALGIEFKNAVISKPDEELIAFIQSNTGKIKPVAVADLDSFLSLGAEMLNIGKPFFLEGIGTITKQRGGGFEFSPGAYVAGDPPTPVKTEKSGKRKSVLEEANFEPQPHSNRKIIVFLAILVGLGIIGWGGYSLYKKNGAVEKKPDINVVVDSNSSPAATDSTAIASLKDSVSDKKNDVIANPPKDTAAFKYVILQTYSKERALRRYNQLRSFELKINMYTKDSSFFKLYFSFPSATKDTVHIKDSLAREYAHAVTIER
ncbi:MAG: hypothetical protein JST75_18010 [Bacteroidetes bacterium]|nr:hypothetical protein [Bacteroidota bacterium]